MLETIIAISFAAYAMACFIRLLDFGMGHESGILGMYYRWLCRVSDLSYKRNEETGHDEIASAKWYYYPLGGCVHCFGFWLCMPVAVALAGIYANHIGMATFIIIAFQGLLYRFTEIQENE